MVPPTWAPLCDSNISSCDMQKCLQAETPIAP